MEKPLDWFAGLDTTDAAAFTVWVAKEFDGWAPELTALITDSDTPPTLRPVFTLPAGHRWDRIPGVTLLGDAAHLRAPNGEGANLAMQDGAELGRALAAHPGNTEAALAAHEQAMFARTAAMEADDDGFYTIRTSCPSQASTAPSAHPAHRLTLRAHGGPGRPQARTAGARAGL